MVSGMSQNSGIGDRSVVMWVVTPSMRLDGTNARPIQRSRRQAVISSEGALRDGVSSGARPAPWGRNCGLPFLKAVLRATVTGGGAAVKADSTGRPESTGG